jgi:hypothetical protein
MNDKPEVPNSKPDSSAAGNTGRPETPGAPLGGTPTVNIGGSYSNAPDPSNPTPTPYADPYSWKPGAYTAGSTPAQGEPTRYTPPPSAPLPQYAPPPQYNPTRFPQDQPSQYTPTQMQPYGGYPQAPQQPPYPQYAYGPPKDPTMGLLLELLGYLGFLGIGHIWAGKTSRGVALLIGYWMYFALSAFLTIFLVGCVMLLATLFIPLLSGFMLKSEMEREQAAMGYRR